MSRTLEVDQFASAPALENFGIRRQLAKHAIHEHRLYGANESEYPALAFGGAALALQEIDAYLPGIKPFDLDVIVMQNMFDRLEKETNFRAIRGLPYGASQGVIEHNTSLPVDVLTGPNPQAFVNFIGQVRHTKEGDGLTPTIEGIRVLDANAVALLKVLPGFARPKDIAGIIKGHVVAHHTGRAIVEDSFWKETIGHAIERASAHERKKRSLSERIRGYPQLPPWLKQLVKVEFEHPAFAEIPRN